tara:strand:+ start:43 stop:3168 length:3126 start_codon:yes stop_codon:yes gene_type:complete
MADELTPRQAVLGVYQALEGTSEDGDVRLKLSNADRARAGAFRYSEGSNREPDLPRLVEDFGFIIEQGDEIGFDELNDEEKAIYEGAKEALRIAAEDEDNTLSSKYISDEKEALAKVTAQAAANSKENFDLDEANVAETLTNGETEEQFRLVQGAYQCFLLYNIEAFAEQHRNLLSFKATSNNPDFANTGTGKLSYAGLDDEGTIQTYGYLDEFEDPRVYLTEENIDGSEVITRAMMKKGYKDLLTIKTHETAHLSPLLRIYKIYRKSETSQMVEFDFDGKTNLDGLAKALTVEHPNNSVLQYSKGTAAGITSFEWSFLGTDPFTATRDIKATLKLRFQDFSTFLKERKGINLYEGGEELKYKYLDLIVQPDCRQDKDVWGQVYLPECYEIRVDIGYHDMSTSVADKTVREEIVDAIQYQKESLYLIPTQHDIAMKDDGSVEVSVTMRGRLEGITDGKRFNILIPGGGFSDGTTGNDLVDTLTRIEKKNEELQRVQNPTGAQKNAIREIEATKTILFAIFRQQLLAGVMRKLQISNMVRKYDIPVTDWTRFLSWQIDTTLPLPQKINAPTGPQDFDAGSVGEILDGNIAEFAVGSQQDDLIERTQAKFVDSIKSGDKVVNYFFLGDLITTVLDSVIGGVQVASSTELVSEKVTYINQLLEKIGLLSSASAEERLAQGSSGRAQVEVQADDPNNDNDSFVELGDTFKYLKKKFKVILGNVSLDIANPGQAPGEVSASEEPVTINLAHIPISTASFYKFMLENVIKPDKQYYSFNSFLSDVLSELVMEMLNSNCLGGLIDTSIKPMVKIYNSKKEFKEDFFVASDGGIRRIDLANVTSANTFFEQTPPRLSVEGSEEDPFIYVFVTAVSRNPSQLNGNYSVDTGKGIPHLYFGADRGLLKSVNFNKTDAEYLPEGRYAAEGKFVFNQLANVYDATFNLVGNTIFIPGQYVYLDASSIGVGKSYHYKEIGEYTEEEGGGKKIERSWSNIMGLGGYHLVTEVTQYIGPGKFNTSMKARWETGGSLPDGTPEDRAEAVIDAVGDEV